MGAREEFETLDAEDLRLLKHRLRVAQQMLRYWKMHEPSNKREAKLAYWREEVGARKEEFLEKRNAIRETAR